MTGRFSDRAFPWLVFALFLALTSGLTYYVWTGSQLADRGRFDNAVDSTRDAISSRIETYVNVLLATRGVVATKVTISREDFHRFVQQLEVQERYPGIQGIGFSLRVQPEEVPRLVEAMRNDGVAGFHIWPEGARGEYHTIVALEPLDRRNLAAIGYDMYTHPVRRDAMIRARDSGAPAATSRVTLVQEIDTRKQPGFLIYVPVYVTGATPSSIEARRQLLFGFVYAPFRSFDLFNGIVHAHAMPEITFEIYQGKEVLYRSGEEVADPRYTINEPLDIAGQRWTVRYASRRSGEGLTLLFTIGTFAAGLAIATLLALLVRTQLRARAAAEETAERLRESQRELERASRAKDEFLATLSHELRTPMTSILGWSQMLAEPDIDRDTLEVALDAIGKSSRIQAQLIDDLLDVSRITTGKMRIERKPLELGAVVDAAIGTVRAMAESKGVKVIASIAPSVFVSGDAPRLQQVFWNLISNAVKFTPRDGEVYVILRSGGGEALVEVRDTGQGIEPEFMPFLFERFRQADSSTTRAYMGLGLGLAIVQHLVNLHGGDVEAHSAGPGTGSTFRVRLPLASRGAELVADEKPQRIDIAHDACVLLVDDDEHVRSYVAAVFRDSAREVRVAASAREAIELLGDWRPDVIISDIGMPQMDGYDFVRWIRNEAPKPLRNVPVIALTAFAMPEDRQRSEAAGFDGFVAKPVEPDVLRAAVAEVMR